MKDLKYLPLFDAYGALLTGHQREVCELYYMCDLSLTEIAEQKGISKQSVSDTASCRRRKIWRGRRSCSPRFPKNTPILPKK